MEEFTPIAMKCTQEQFDAIKPKLDNQKSLDIFMFNKKWNSFYLALFEDGRITNGLTCSNSNTLFYEEWNEEIFLKACGIEVETLQEKALRLQNELEEVNRQIKEENKPKVGDWVKCNSNFGIRKVKSLPVGENWTKITNKGLIRLLEKEVK